MADAIDHREPARDALQRARLTIPDADAADVPLIWATLGTGLAAMTIASAIMTTGTRIARALEDISAQLADVNKAIR